MPATRLSNLDRLLLGLMRQTPMSGYDIGAQFARSPLIRFSPSPGSIYPALRRLRRAGLIRGRVERQRPLRPREVFELTPRGRKTLEEWLGGPTDRQDVVLDLEGLLLRFSLMGGVRPLEEQVQLLKEIRQGCADYVRELQTYTRTEMSHAPLTGKLALELGIEGYATHARWATRAIARVRRDGAASKRAISRRNGGC